MHSPPPSSFHIVTLWYGAEIAHVVSKGWSQNQPSELNFLQTCGNVSKNFAPGMERFVVVERSRVDLV